MPVPDDFTIDFATGNIRHASGATVYDILDLHAWLQDRSDDADGRDNDIPSDLSGKRDATKPAILVLPNDGPEGTEYNIDDAAAEFLNFGSIEQEGGDTLYTGLKSAGNIVAASPIYLVQSNAKLTKYWPDGHIQLLVKAKTGGVLIDSGDIGVYSRKYGQTYSHFDANLAAGSEQFASISTEDNAAITLSEAAALAIFAGLTVTVGDTTQDLGNGNGPKLYKGTIDCNGEALEDVYQALMAACAEDSAETLAGVPGWRYRKLNSGYADNVSNPFGPFLGGVWFVAQGWWITNYLAGDAENFRLRAHDGTEQIPPTQTGVTLGNLVAGDSLLVARSATPGGAIIKNLYTLAAGNDLGDGTIVIKEAIAVDTPASGIFRLGDDRYAYASWTGSTFTLTGTLTQNYAEDAPGYVPLIDGVATGATESVSVIYPGVARALTGSVRRGTGGGAIKGFPVSATMGETPIEVNAVRNSEV